MRCPEYSEILDLVESRLDSGSVKKVEAHVAGCSDCHERRQWAERTMAAMRTQNRVFDAPEYAVQKAISLVSGRKAGLGEWIKAKLDFDSWAVPAAAGVRSEEQGSRQCVYVTDAYRVHLMLDTSKKTVRMTGQLVANAPSAEPAHCLVEATDSLKSLGQATTNESGEFLLEVPRNKQVQLKIHGDPESILISCKL